MHVFVTGGTGTIGTPVVAELLAHGHSVTALARSDHSAAALEAAGAATVRGSLDDLSVLHDGRFSCRRRHQHRFSSDYSSTEALEAGMAQERAAMEALGEALIGTDKPLVVVSGTPGAEGRPSTESDPLPHFGPVAARADSVEAVLALASQGVRSASVRLPRTVHADGKGGFAGLLTEAARASGIVQYPGDGSQRWPAVHAADAASLFRLVLETAPAGTAWHAVADEGDAVADIAEVIGRRLGVPVEQIAVEDAGPFGPIFATDQPSTSAHTREALGWTPTHPSLLADLELIEP